MRGIERARAGNPGGGDSVDPAEEAAEQLYEKRENEGAAGVRR